MSSPADDPPCPPPETRPERAGRRVAISPDDLGWDGTWPMPSGSGPCRTWPLEPGCGCLAPGSTRNGGNEPSPWGGANTWTPEQQHAVEAATEILWRATGGAFGLCWETVLPCRRKHAQRQLAAGGLSPLASNFTAVSCGRCGSEDQCGCPDPDEITLPGPVYWEPLRQPSDWRTPWRPPDARPDPEGDGTIGPRYRLVVWIDGHVLREPGWPLEWQPGDETVPADYTPAQGDYWLVESNRLKRMDGRPWPSCPDLSALIQPRVQYPHEARGSFAIQYWRGTPVPPGGRRAVSMLACELWKACVGDKTCRLPQHVQSVTREGVQYQMVDTTDYTQGGKTGLPDVDMWLSQVNPHGMRQQVGVYSPDLPRVQGTWSSGGRS